MALFDPVSIAREIEATPFSHARNVVIAYPHREDWKKLYRYRMHAAFTAMSMRSSGVIRT